MFSGGGGSLGWKLANSLMTPNMMRSLLKL